MMTSNYTGGAITGAGYDQAAQKAAYLGAEATAVPAETSLMRLAYQIEHATTRVEGIAGNLSQLAIGLHGPRPEPVNSQDGIKAGGDSFAMRISSLMQAIDRLQRSYDSIVR